MTNPEALYQARLTYIRQGIAQGYTANRILREMQSTPLKMRRQSFLELTRDVLAGKARESLRRNRFRYSTSRFYRDQEWKFQGHVLDRWRRDTYADLKVFKKFESPKLKRRRVVTRAKPIFITVYLGEWTRSDWIALSNRQVLSLIQNQVEQYGLVESDWEVIGIWASKFKAAFAKRSRG